MKPKAKQLTRRTRGGNPSICKWVMSATFKTKEQCAEFIRKVFEAEVNVCPAFSFKETEVGGVAHFTVNMEYHWASNLVIFAELLADVDFQEN